ncbi:pyruvate kinase-like protein [Camillea tinctor]|nr:pyruvate kinase-like protein [Camillea tinctor]
MEVVAVSRSKPTFHYVNGIKLYTSIIHDPLTRPSDYIELDESGILGNKTAVHDGPVYVFFTENYDYWCRELGVEQSSWDWCHWGENVTLRFKNEVALEDEIHLGDIWKIGDSLRLEKDSWLQSLAASGRVGVYLRVLRGGRIHPGDGVSYERFSGDPMDIATITRVAFDASLKTRDTMDLLANHKLLLGMNKWTIKRKLATMDDKLNSGKNSWKGWRDLRPYRIVDEGGDVKSFYLRPVDGEPLANYLPGQFLSVRTPTGKTCSWSISDWLTRDNPSYYRLSIKKAGEASTWMHDTCNLETVLPTRSPAGRFFLDWTSFLPMRQVYLSAGVGITPILTMMKSHDVHPNFEVTPVLWIHVARDSAHFPFRDEIPQFRRRTLKKVVFFTEPSRSDVQGVDYDYKGRPVEQELESIIGASFTWHPLGAGEMTSEGNFSAANICGPPAFEELARKCLQNLKFPAPLIRSESFVAASGAAASGEVGRARVKFVRSKTSAEWVKDKPMSLLELAESQGLTPDYGCRVGACGSCATKLMCGSVSGRIQADGTVLACSATPASESIEVDM